MMKLVVIALAVACVSLTSCANTIRGVGKDTKQTAVAFQDGTTDVLKAGSTKKKTP